MSARDASQAVLLLAATVAAAVGWIWAADPPQASAGLSLLFGLVLAATLKAAAARLSWRLTALACTYGIGYQASALACVAWYPALSSRSVGVCDEGTGLPVGLLYCVGALLVAAELLSTRGRT